MKECGGDTRFLRYAVACGQTDRHIRYIRSHLLGAEYYKYQLSLIDPRDKIGLQTELDDFCDKLQWSSFGHRAMEVTRSERPPFSSKVDSTFDDRYAEAKFSKSEV